MKKNNQFIAQFGIAVFIALSTASCGLLQKDTYEYHIEVPDVYTLQDSLSSTDSTNIALIQWEDFFNDEQLTILIQKGLEHNFDMKKALANIEIAQLKANQAKLNWLPSVDANIANLAYQYRSENFYSNPSGNWHEHTGKEPPKTLYNFTNQHSSGLLVSWEIDVWGKFRDQKEMALNEYLETEEARKVIQTELITEIAEGYYNLILLYAQLDVSQANFDLSKNTLEIVQLQYEAGQITALAKQQTKSQMLTAKALIPSLKQQIALQENQLNYLTGSFPKEIDISTKKLENYFYLDVLSEGVPLQLLQNRPDIQAAQLELHAANSKVGLAQKQKYPSIKIDLGGGVNSMLPENWFNIPGALFRSVVGGVTAPIFNKKKLQTNYEVAMVERNKTEIYLQKTVHKAITEVSDALILLKTIDEQ